MKCTVRSRGKFVSVFLFLCALGGLLLILQGLQHDATAAQARGAASTQPAMSELDEPQVEDIKALLDKHDKAMTAHDIDGVLALYSPGDRAVVMGTGPGECWVGKDRIRFAYEHFFADYDPGEQDFVYDWKLANANGDVAWLSVMGFISMSKQGVKQEFPLNISTVFEKTDGQWHIAQMHFSNLTGPEPETTNEGAAEPARMERGR